MFEREGAVDGAVLLSFKVESVGPDDRLGTVEVEGCSRSRTNDGCVVGDEEIEPFGIGTESVSVVETFKTDSFDDTLGIKEEGDNEIELEGASDGVVMIEIF